MKAKKYPIRYLYNFCVGQNTHIVRVYDSYSEEDGLGDPIMELESPRLRDVVKGSHLTAVQRKRLKGVASDRGDCIILTNGEFRGR